MHPTIGEVKGMQSIVAKNPEGVPPPGGHYSHAVVANGLMFISGQLPITEQGEKLTHESFERQARQVLSNVAAILRAYGSDIADLVQVRVYIDSMENWPAFNEIYAEWAGASRPARAVVPTGPLHYGLRVEVEATAIAR
jgi:2-iminobutanoate/2-iminopropanoate deaminase